MALWSIDVEKRLGSEFWSNRYIVSDLGGVTPEGQAEDIVTMERNLHSTAVTLTRYRISSLAPGDGIYTIVPYNQLGLRDVGSSLLPLFNTLRIDLTAAIGRPSRKFYRGVLTEADINGDAMTANITATEAAFNALLAAGTTGGIVDPQGGLLTGVVVYRFVQMRQLRRSRRKRTNGGGIFQ